MYIPRAFEVKDRTIIDPFIHENGFGVLVSQGQEQPDATHLPFLYVPGEGGQGVLYTHMARSNPQWKTLRSDKKVLAIFTGEHGYISPSWYETTPSVPTWDYTAVHVYGLPELIEDGARVRTLLTELVEFYEKQNGTHWKMEFPDDYLQRMISAIVWVKVNITEVQAQFKLSQNRSDRDKVKVIASLKLRSGAQESLAHIIERFKTETRV